MELGYILLMTLLGAILGGFLFCIPGISVFSLSGLFITLWISHPRLFSPPLIVMAFFMSLTVSYSFINTIPAFFFGAPTGSTLFLVAPGRKFLREGRSYLACMTVAIGSLIAVFLLVASIPLLGYLFRPLLGFMRRKIPWLLGALILYMLGGEFIYHLRRGMRLNRQNEYRALFAAPLIFLLIGGFGFILFQFRRYLPVHWGGELSAAFAGLILVPHLLRGIFAPVIVCADERETFAGERKAPLFGSLAGCLGGIPATFFPGIGAGLGAFLSGHFIPRGREKTFLISQGIIKTFYYVGAFLLFFMPGLHPIRRGGMALRLSSFYTPSRTPQDYWIMVGVILISGALSFFLLNVASRLASRLVRRIGSRVLSSVFVILVLVMTFIHAGIRGWGVMLLGTCLGSLPLLFGCRRSNVFAFLLLPIWLLMMGWLRPIALILGIN